MKKFLIVQLASFGDCLYATAIARQIKNDNPNNHVTWAIAKRFASILHLNPYVDQILEIDLPAGTAYYDPAFDKKFRESIAAKKTSGEFDEIIFSQIPQKNWTSFTGTIRATTLAAYPGKITVPVQPIVVLSEGEKNNVKFFAEKHQLQNYKEVILFECAPSSGQSLVNVNFALSIAKQSLNQFPSTCFILSTPAPIETGDARIIDASGLSFRENAALSKYCSFLIGCSSGITWICTSQEAKQLNTLQLLNREAGIYAGLNFDFSVHGIDNSHVVEMIAYTETDVMACLKCYFQKGMKACRDDFNQHYAPNALHLKIVAGFLIDQGESFTNILHFANRYCQYNAALNNPIPFNKAAFVRFMLTRRLSKYWPFKK